MRDDLFGKRNAFTHAAWAFVLYLIGVILFGAWVRITGSGAGCGAHWPTCHGNVVPILDNVKTQIEFTHRVTSGACGLFSLAIVGWAWRTYGRGRILYAALVTLLFVIVEGAVGAGIVLKELVEDDSSVARAVVISFHLVNTLALTGSAALTAWWAGGNPLPSLRAWPARSAFALLALFSIGLVSMSGAITALGDTLFPVDPATSGDLFAHVREGISTTNHFLVRLRVVHPILAVVSAAGLLGLANHIGTRDTSPKPARRWALLCAVSVIGNVGLGLLNIVLHAPGFLQLGHLFVAQCVWITTLVMCVAYTAPKDA